jgi:hypothetical protein
MHPDDKSDLDRIYEGARELFQLGEHDRALERFKSVYEVACTFRDVEEIINDYYDTGRSEWLTKYETRFLEQQRTA